MQLSINHLLNGISSIFHLSFLRFAFLALLLLCFRIGKSQFHPSISPVLKSTTFSSSDYLINQDGNAVITSFQMFVGIVDTVTKEILYDTSYFRPSCPFGANGFGTITTHHKGGYIGAGLLNECDRDQAILLWMNDTLAEVESFLTPIGFQGTQPEFIEVATDELTNRIYAVKVFKNALWNTGKKPVLLYTLTDSLELLAIDTLIEDQSGNPSISLDVQSGIGAIRYWDNDSLNSKIKVWNLDNSQLLFTKEFRFSEERIDEVHFENNVLFVLSHEIIRDDPRFPRINSFIKSYDLNGDLVSRAELIGSETSITSASFISDGKGQIVMVYDEKAPFFNGSDTLIQLTAKAIFFDPQLSVTNEIDIAKGPSFIPSNTGYAFDRGSLKAAHIDEEYLYYYIDIKDDFNSSNVYHFNRISLDYVLSNSTSFQSELELELFPNPASDYIQIKSSKSNASSLRISDIIGKTILDIEYTDRIDISNLPSGTYIITLYDSKGRPLNSNLFIH